MNTFVAVFMLFFMDKIHILEIFSVHIDPSDFVQLLFTIVYDRNQIW